MSPSGGTHDCLIVGGGIAGLTAALGLADAGRSPVVLEAADRAGGHFRAEREGEWLFPWGPQAIPGFAREAFRLVARLGLDDRLVEARGGGKRWVWLDGRRTCLPTGPGAFLTSPFLSTRGKLRLLAEPWRRPASEPDPEESVSSFFGRRLGVEAVRSLVAPFVTGIYAGDPDRLEARSAFPRLARWERDAGSLVRGAWRERRRKRQEERPSEPEAPRRRGLWSFREGLAELSDAAAAELGDRLRLRTPVREIVRENDTWRVSLEDGEERARDLVLAVPPPEAARLLAGVDAEAAELAASVPMAPVVVVHLGGPVPSGAEPPEGFGLLIPREAGFRTLGTIFTSSLFPGRAPEGCWLQTTFLGGVTAPELIDRPDDEIRALVADESKTLLGFDPDAGTCHFFRHRAAIPQLVAGHVDRIEALRARVAGVGGLVLAGNWLEGVGLEQAIESGRRAADGLLGVEAAA